MEDSKPSQQSKDEPTDATKFTKSLQELREMCSTLHHAADYCEASYLSSEQKKSVVENTKEYLCKAVVTVVDHLGSVSDRIDRQLSKARSFSDTEFRIDCLKQKLMVCQQYSNKLSLSRVKWIAEFPRYHHRYISLPRETASMTHRQSHAKQVSPDECMDTRRFYSPQVHLRKSNESSREAWSPLANKTAKKQEFEADEEVSTFLYTYNCKPSLLLDDLKIENHEKMGNSSTQVLPVGNVPSALPKTQRASFIFQATPKIRRSLLNWSPRQNNHAILSRIRRGKRRLT